MQQPYKIPLHHCQWCYKATGRFIIDCLCIACESCFHQKNSWVDQNAKCFYCEKPTQRKFIDLKVNPQQGGIYFQNLNISMKNMMKIQEFQSQVSRKYCKHLEKKVFKLQTVIKTFIKQFPQYQSFFEKMMTQMQQQQNNKFRSKSVNETDSQSSQSFGRMVFHNNTVKNIHKQNLQIRSNSKTAYFKPQNKMKNNAPSEKSSVNSHQFQDYQQKRNKFIYPNVSKKQTESIHGDYFENNSLKFGDNNRKKNPSYQQFNQAESMRSNQSSNFMNVSKNEAPIQIYQVGGNNKFSDPTKQQVNLNNINMQTALRSIKSEDGRDNFLPFYQHNHIDARRNNKKNQPTQNLNIQSPKNIRNQNADSFIFHRKK